MSELNERTEVYYEARRAYDTAKAASNVADAVRRQRERELVDYMIENQITSVGRDDGTKPSLVSSVSISISKDNYEPIREWLRETIGDDTDYVETVVSKSAVLELVKAKIKLEKWDVDDFPVFLRPDTRPALRVTGWKGLTEE